MTGTADAVPLLLRRFGRQYAHDRCIICNYNGTLSIDNGEIHRLQYSHEIVIEIVKIEQVITIKVYRVADRKVMLIENSRLIGGLGFLLHRACRQHVFLF